MHRSVLISLALALPALALTPQEEINTKGPAARAILDTWQNENPQRAPRKLRIMVWTPADREPAPNYRQRLSAILLDIQKFYAKEMQRNGFGPRTIQLDIAADGMIPVDVVKGSKPYSAYRVESGDEIRRDCKAALAATNYDVDKETIVIFCNMSNWDADKRTISQNSPYYASGTNCHGTAWQVDSPILSLDLLTKTDIRVKDGQYGDITIGKYNSIFIGGIAHEMGHALGLPHNTERPEESEALGNALMGDGNRSYGDDLRKEGKGTFLNFAHALQLASHPMFSGSIKGMFDKASAAPVELNITTSGQDITIAGRVKAKVPVYGVIAYFDPAGGGDYDATTATAVPDAQGKFSLSTTALKKDKAGELRLFFLEANGLAAGFLSDTPFKYPYTVASDGTVNLAAIKAQGALAPLVQLAIKGNASSADAMKQLKAIDFTKMDAKVEEAANALVRAAFGNEPAAAPVDATGNTCELAFAKPASATVGYGRAKQGLLPEDPYLYLANGKLFRNGLYAHAPSRYTYHLGGKWNTFTACAGLAQSHDGTVVCKVIADGKTVFESKKLDETKLANIKLDVKGVQQLVLETSDAGDGTRSDWATWLEPVLTR